MTPLSQLNHNELDSLMFECPLSPEKLKDFVTALVRRCESSDDVAVLAKRVTNFNGRTSAALTALLLVELRAADTRLASDFVMYLFDLATAARS